MLFYLAMFFSFLYFKIARVYKKEEKLNSSIIIQHAIVSISSISLLSYAALNIQWYAFLPLVFVFAIISSLMITTIQLGIFVDGKPIFGLKKLYALLPVLTFFIALSSSLAWISFT